MEPNGPERPPDQPAGSDPAERPHTSGMPRWPGALLVIGGGVLAIFSLGAATLVAQGELVMEDPAILAWLALGGVIALVTGLVYMAVRQLRVRRHLPPERYRGPSVFILLALVLAIGTVLTAPFSSDAAVIVTGEGELTLLGAIVILMSTQVALLLVGWLFVWRTRALAGRPRLPGPNPGGAITSGLGWGVVAWLGATIVSALVVVGLEAIGVDPGRQPAERAIALVDPWVVIVAVVLLAPIAEEAFFRGIVFNAWLREAGRRMAYFGSAALFAVIHLSIASVVPIFLLGLALSWVYRRTGNLLAPIAMHATVNGISVAFALLVRFEVVPIPT